MPGPELSCYNFRLDDRKTAFSRSSGDPRPDIRMRNLLIQQRRKGCHVRPVVQDDVDRADLSTSPTDSFNAHVLIVEGCGVGLTEYAVRRGRDLSSEFHPLDGYTDEVEERQHTHALGLHDPQTGRAIHQPDLAERLRHRTTQRSARVPDGTGGMRCLGTRMVIKTAVIYGTVRAAAMPRAPRRLVNAHELLSKRQLNNRRFRGKRNSRRG